MVKAVLITFRPLIVIVIAAGLAVFSGAASAEPFGETACAALADEQTKLIKDGVIADRDRGPEWARANLGAGRIKEILHSIEVDEQLMFRCRIGGLTVAAKRAGEQADKIELNPNATAVKPEAGAADEKTNKNGAAAAKEHPKPTKRKARPHKRKPKPKHNDAYSPPKAATSIFPMPMKAPSASAEDTAPDSLAP